MDNPEENKYTNIWQTFNMHNFLINTSKKTQNNQHLLKHKITTTKFQ